MPSARSTAAREVNSPAELLDALGSADRVVIASPELIEKAECLLGPDGRGRTVEQPQVLSAFTASLPARHNQRGDNQERTMDGERPATDESTDVPQSSSARTNRLRELREEHRALDTELAELASNRRAESDEPVLQRLKKRRIELRARISALESPSTAAPSATELPPRAGHSQSADAPSRFEERPPATARTMSKLSWLVLLAVTMLLVIGGAAVWLKHGELSPVLPAPSAPGSESPSASQPPMPNQETRPARPPTPSQPEQPVPRPSAPAFDMTALIWPVVVLIGMVLAFLLVRHALSGEEEVTFTAQWKVHKLVDGRIELVRGKATGRTKRRHRAVAT